MNGILVLLATSAIGVDFGWKPIEDGSLEYIIQVEPELLEIIKSGEPIINEIPNNVRGARRLRIIVGREKLPREGQSLLPADSQISRPGEDVFGGEPPAGNSFNALPPPTTTPWDHPPPGDPAGTSIDTPAMQPFGAPHDPNAPLPQRPIPDPDPVEINPFPPTSSTFPTTPTGNELAAQTTDYTHTNETVPSKVLSDEESKISSTNKDSKKANKETAKEEKKDEQSTSSLASLPWILFFASMGLNMYLAGLARIYYRRYRGLAEQARSERRAAA